MTGASAQQTLRPARRMHSTIDGSSPTTTPPVLFRLPPISLPAMPAAAEASNRAGTLACETASVNAAGDQQPVRVACSEPAHAPASKPQAWYNAVWPLQNDLGFYTALEQIGRRTNLAAPNEVVSKKSRQRLLNTVIAVLLLIALVVISLLAFRNPPSTPELASSQPGKTGDPLESLANISLPQISDAATQNKAHELSTSESQSAASNLISGTQGDHLAGPYAAQRTAQVQLRTPVPILDSTDTSLADAKVDSTEKASRTELSPTTRYETVSTPSSTMGASEKPRESESGASPTFYNGAAKTPEPQRSFESGLTLGAPTSAEPSLSTTLGNQPPPSESATATAPASPKGELKLSGPSLGDVKSDSVNLGVTVGGGLLHPSNLGQKEMDVQSTATPDMDSARIIEKFVEHRAEKNAMLASNGSKSVNSSAPESAPVGASSAMAPGSGGGYVPGAPRAGSTSAIPYGMTGSTITPYVRNAPGAQPSGLNIGSSPASTSVGFPTSSTAPGASYAIPPRGQNLSTQVVNPYAGGQAPIGMIGQSGYATAPSGDFVGGVPTPVTGTMGHATSVVGGMPSGPQPTTQSSNPYSVLPQYR